MALCGCVRPCVRVILLLASEVEHMARGRAVRVPLASPAQRPLAAAARAVKPPPPESMTAAAVVDARCGGSQRTPQRPQCNSTGSGSRGSSGGSGSGSAAATAASSASSSSAAAAAMAAAAALSVQLVAAGCQRQPAPCMNSFQSRAQRMAEGGRGSRVPWRSAVGRSRPTAALRARRCAHKDGARTMPAMHCACVLTAVHRVLVQYSPSRPRSSHRAHPTALVPYRSRPSALTLPRSSHYVRPLYTRIDRVRFCMLCVRTCMSRSLPQSILFS